MGTKNILKRLVCDSIAIIITAMIITPFSSPTGVLAESDGFEQGDFNYPYTHTFTISAYYSPLACQDRYATGSYRGDIRLNGNGTNGADGTPVYPGMIAAPKLYSFGTKMYIPGVGIVAVHDRGGAIIEHDGENNLHNRLDIWMGYGDIGLTRALSWGKRNVAVTVYGLSDIEETIELPGYSPSEAIAPECDFNEEEGTYEPAEEEEEEAVLEEEDDTDFEELLEEFDEEIVESVELSSTVNSYMSFGDTGASVTALQKELKNINFYMANISGVYDDVTEHAVFKFQQSQGIIASTESFGAGVYGPSTSARLNEIVGSRNYTNVLVASNTNDYWQTSNGNYIALKPDEDDFIVAAN